MPHSRRPWYRQTSHIWDYLFRAETQAVAFGQKFRRTHLGVEGLEDRIVMARPLPFPLIAVGTEVGASATVQAYRADTGEPGVAGTVLGL